MNLWREIGVVWGKIWFVVFLVSAGTLVLVPVLLEPDDERVCWESGMENAALVACWQNPGCNLSNDEIKRMYVSGKKAIMACTTNQIRKIREGAVDMDVQPQEDQEKDDMRAGN